MSTMPGRIIAALAAVVLVLTVPEPAGADAPGVSVSAGAVQPLSTAVAGTADDGSMAHEYDCVCDVHGLFILIGLGHWHCHHHTR